MVCYRPNMEHAIQISNRTQSIHAMNRSVLCCNYQINAVRKSFLFFFLARSSVDFDNI